MGILKTIPMSFPIAASTSERSQPKLQLACERLEQLAATLQPGERLPTIQQMRREFGVSLTTLNSALEEMEARKVLQRRNGVGVFVAPRATRTVALLCDPSFLEGNAHSPLWSALVKGLRERIEAAGETLEIHFARPATPKTPPIPDALAWQLEQKRVQGVLGLGLHLETVQWLQNAGVPLVGFACWGDEETHHVSYAHGQQFFEAAIAILREQNCRVIEAWFPVMSWMWPNHQVGSGRWRELCGELGEQIAAAARGTGVAVKARFLTELLEQQNPQISHQEQGFQLAQTVFGPQSNVQTKPDGIIMWDDMTAHGALIGLHRLGVDVGQQVVIVSQSNAGSPVLERESDEITRLEFEPQAVVALMFEQIETLMENEAREPRPLLVPATRRDSSLLSRLNSGAESDE